MISSSLVHLLPSSLILSLLCNKPLCSRTSDPLHYFLGPQLQYHSTGFSVHQTKYTEDLLTSLVGALQYLTFTRPDISFAVNQVCQFMHSPTDIHLTAAKCILRCLSGSLHHVLFRPGSLQLQAYADADWADSTFDHQSTSGYVVFLGSTPNHLGFQEAGHCFSIFNRDRISKSCLSHR
uniref:Reverse transcriptase Ty1/copia-type domain-containing protein n=1 Tax=Fagus sylvatica TaxID=28930 RepID=A0A2N9H2H0_FAGSY